MALAASFTHNDEWSFIFISVCTVGWNQTISSFHIFMYACVCVPVMCVCECVNNHLVDIRFHCKQGNYSKSTLMENCFRKWVMNLTLRGFFPLRQLVVFVRRPVTNPAACVAAHTDHTAHYIQHLPHANTWCGNCGRVHGGLKCFIMSSDPNNTDHYLMLLQTQLT